MNVKNVDTAGIPESRSCQQYVRSVKILDGIDRMSYIHTKVNNAVATGKLKRDDTCAICKQHFDNRYGCGTIAHHDDYSKPLDVRWLCRPCHMRYHQGIKPVIRAIDLPICEECKSDKVTKAGFKVTKGKKLQRYQCKACGHIFTA